MTTRKSDGRLRSAVRGRTACGWSVVFAALHLYWALGGEWALSVSAGPLARERPGWFVAAGLRGMAFLCLVGAALGWLLSRPRPVGRIGRALRALGWGVCAVLMLRGIAVEGLLLADPTGRTVDVSPDQRVWTLVLWNPWFLAGGAAFGLAARAFRGPARPYDAAGLDVGVNV